MPSRRDFLKTSSLASASALLPNLLSAIHHASGTNRMNVLMIITDDMNDYGFYKGYPGIQMPYLDAFRESALTFRHGYCASPVCGPSRAAVFSGLYPHTTGAYLNGSDPWREESILSKTETLPECLRRNGYYAYGNGKLFHAKLTEGRIENNFDNQPHGGGFGPFHPEEDFLIPAGQGGAPRFWGYTPDYDGPDDDFPDVRNAKDSIQFLQQSHEKPFFLAYGQWRPHTPFTAPKRFFDLYDFDDIPLPPGYLKNDLEDIPPTGIHLSKIWGPRWDHTGASDEEKWRKTLHGFAANHTFADWTAGMVLEALDNSPYADNTIVVYWSDNGYHMGEKDHFEKATVWEKSALTPFAIRVPGMTPGGTTCIRPVNTIDIYPTLVDLLNLKPPAHDLEGLSLKPLLQDPASPWARPAITTYGEGIFSARDEQFRYIRYPDGKEELYDHQVDPHEWKNLAIDPIYQPVKNRLALWLPESWAPSLGGRNG